MLEYPENISAGGRDVVWRCKRGESAPTIQRENVFGERILEYFMT